MIKPAARSSPTVIIEYQPAARVGDKTAHGGVITSGCSTVVIMNLDCLIDRLIIA
jgi:uncharacterized Zn-binding protein involved in type VI secretion